MKIDAPGSEPFYNSALFCDEHRPSVELLNLAEDGVEVDPNAKSAAEETHLLAITECPDCMALHDAAFPIDPDELEANAERAMETFMRRVHTRIAEGIVTDIFPDGVPEGLTEEDMLRLLKGHVQGLRLRVELAFTGEDEGGMPITWMDPNPGPKK